MQYSNLSASAAVKDTPGKIHGVIVNSHTSGTLRLNDGASGTTSAGVKATQTLTASGVFSNGETITIGDVTYTMVTTMDNTAANNVLIGASAAASLDNLKQAVNQGDTEGGGEDQGTNYSTGTVPNPKVTATTNTDTTQVVQARHIGTAGNSIATTEACANAAWGDTTLASGAAASYLMSNTFTFTSGSGVYMFGPGMDFTQSLYATIGGTADITIIYE